MENKQSATSIKAVHIDQGGITLDATHYNVINVNVIYKFYIAQSHEASLLRYVYSVVTSK